MKKSGFNPVEERFSGHFSKNKYQGCQNTPDMLLKSSLEKDRRERFFQDIRGKSLTLRL